MIARPWLQLAGLAAAATVLSVSLPADALTMWTTEVEARRQAYLRLLAEVFATEHPGWSVSVVGVPEDDLLGLLAGTVAEGQPDLIHADLRLIEHLYLIEGLVDVERTEALLPAIGAGSVYPGVLAAHRDDESGALFALPNYAWIQGVWYRRDWLADSSLEPPSTLDQLDVVADGFFYPEAGFYGAAFGTAGDIYGRQMLSQYLSASGFTSLDDVAERPADVAETLARVLRLSRRGPSLATVAEARGYFLRGQAAQLVYSTFIIDDLALAELAASSLGQSGGLALAGEGFTAGIAANTGFAPVLEGAAAATYGTAVSFAVLQGRDGEEGAHDAGELRAWLELLNEPDVYIDWLHSAPGGMLPVYPAILGDPAFRRDPLGVLSTLDQETFDALDEGLSRLEPASLLSYSVADPRLAALAALVRQAVADGDVAVTAEAVSNAMQTD